MIQELPPQSQRGTIPTPPPAAELTASARTVGQYLIVNERAVAKRVRRAAT